jgi:hypothetical protein
MTKRVFHSTSHWALGADMAQWILYRRRSRKQGGWEAVSFVSSTWEVLERCLREKGVDDDTACFLLRGLPDTFQEWKHAQQWSAGRGGGIEIGRLPF